MEKNKDQLAEQSSATLHSMGRQAKARDLIAYWVLGMCNNFGYVVMLSAANELLSKPSNDGDGDKVVEIVSLASRKCNEVSTGAILLANVLPALIIKLIAPFLPLMTNFRVICTVVLSIIGFLQVAFSKTESLIFIGVSFTSLASGLGEVTFLSYSSYYHENVISTWSSGTGGAGIFGAASYWILSSVIKLPPETTICSMCIVPLITIVSFWFILTPPETANDDLEADLGNVSSQVQIIGDCKSGRAPHTTMTFKEKLLMVGPLLKYMIPLGTVYFFEYFINQGLSELIDIPSSGMTPKDIYPLLSVMYQVGVFISRSSVNLFHIRQLWLISVLQLANLLIYGAEVIYFFIPYLWIVMVLTLWEGLLGGASYVNTYVRISREEPSDRKEFSMAVTSFSDSIGIVLAGFLALPAHNALCRLPGASS